MALFSRTHLVAGTQLMAPLLKSQQTSAAGSFSLLDADVRSFLSNRCTNLTTWELKFFSLIFSPLLCLHLFPTSDPREWGWLWVEHSSWRGMWQNRELCHRCLTLGKWLRWSFPNSSSRLADTRIGHQHTGVLVFSFVLFHKTACLCFFVSLSPPFSCFYFSPACFFLLRGFAAARWGCAGEVVQLRVVAALHLIRLCSPVRC